jgi:tripartite motif-containing protein 71
MRKKIFILLSICVVFVFIGGVTSYAQLPASSYPEHEIEGKYRSEKTAVADNRELDAIAPGSRSDFNASPVSIAGSPGAVTLGKPGLSFKYDQTFGTTGDAYFDDDTHLNDPRGVGTDGENIWIVECKGRRALKYANDDTTTVLMQIGKAGYRITQDTQMNCLMDVAVDSAGNIWLVDITFNHVIEYDSSGEYVGELGEDWDYGSGNDQFANPYGVAVDSDDNVYVSDKDNHRVQVFDNDRNYLATIGSGPGSGADQFDTPKHITIDGNDRLYVADYQNQRVQIFDVSEPITPTILHSIDLYLMGGNPEGVAVDLTNNHIFVADWSNKKILVYNATTWDPLPSISIFLNNKPFDVAVDASGNLYVTQHNAGQVRQYDSSLILQRYYGTENVPYLTDNYHYNRPSGVAIGADDSIYIVEGRGQRLIKLSSGGIFQWVKGEPGIQDYDIQHFSDPQDVDTDINGRVYAADSGNCRIQIYNSDGSNYNTLNGNCDNGVGEFEYAEGVAVAPNGNIYVADSDNARIQVYDSSLEFQASLTQTGSTGGNLPFTYIVDVDADASGNIYVVDSDQQVVHIFNSSLQYQRSLGEYGVDSYAFGYFSFPEAVTVDGEGRTYVADKSGNRIQVFDRDGAFLTALAGNRGGGTGQLFISRGLAVDSQGSLYIADQENQRVQKFTLGVEGWKQVNINGFGDVDNIGITALEIFNDYLYAGTDFWGETGAQIWRMEVNGDWEQAVSDGPGGKFDYYVDDLIEFDGKLYAGIGNQNWDTSAYEGGSIWRSANGTDWDQVVSGGFTDPYNGEIANFAVFSDTLYATTTSYTSTHGAEIWTSTTGDSGDWNLNTANGFGNSYNTGIFSMITYKGCLYAGTSNSNLGIEGAEIWVTCDGIDWNQVIDNGFGDVYNQYIGDMGIYNGRLYAGTSNSVNQESPDPGAEVWSCAATCADENNWTINSTGKGFGDPNNKAIFDLLVLDNIFYATTYNSSSGLEVWKTSDGDNWQQVNPDGFGDSLNFCTWGSSASAIFNDELYFGTHNTSHAGEVWKYIPPKIFLPVIVR